HKSLTLGIIQTSLATASLNRDFLSREKRMTAGRRRRQTPSRRAKTLKQQKRIFDPDAKAGYWGITLNENNPLKNERVAYLLTICTPERRA
ncbi:MAG: hypothetical protein LIP00_11140, partial [Parabacteroides sp.]|nr:hypothetical protein [Parabacteroides sp.]